MKIRSRILTNVCAVIIGTVLVVITAMGWSLNEGIKIQIDNLSSGLEKQVEQREKANSDILRIILNTLDMEIRTIASDICQKDILKRNFESGQNGALAKYLESISAESQSVDFGIFFDYAGNLAASYPDNINYSYMNNQFRKIPPIKSLKRYIDEERIEQAELQVGHIDLTPEEATSWGIDKEKTRNGAILFVVVGLIPNDFMDEVLGYIILGKSYNGFNMPFRVFSRATNGVSAVYRGRNAIAYGGFSDKGNLDLKDLELPESWNSAKQEEKGLIFDKILLDNRNYYSTFLPVIDVYGKEIGSFMVGEDEKDIVQTVNVFNKEGNKLKKNVLYILLIIGASAITAGLLIMTFFSARLVKPLKKAVKIASDIAGGDLRQNVDIYSSDEIGDLGEALRLMVKNLETARNELISNRDAVELRVRVQKEILSMIGESSEEVAERSEKFSESSNFLSQKLSEQSGLLEEISNMIKTVNDQSAGNAKNSTLANDITFKAREVAEDGNKKMKEMISAMEGITGSSREILKILDVLKGIAEQTNLLALNATIEATRAGQSGRGFAVVAQEVKDLAHRSSEAVKDTASLLKKSSEDVHNGSEIAEKTAIVLDDIVESVVKVTEFIREISTASNDQASNIARIKNSLNDINSETSRMKDTAEKTSMNAKLLTEKSAQLVTHLNLKLKENEDILSIEEADMDIGDDPRWKEKSELATVSSNK